MITKLSKEIKDEYSWWSAPERAWTAEQAPLVQGFVLQGLEKKLLELRNGRLENEVRSELILLWFQLPETIYAPAKFLRFAAI